MRCASTSLVLLAIFLVSAVEAAEPGPIESVRPMIGTAEHGHTYPGATVPFGMVQLSPDTRLKGWDGCSGYHRSDKTILGFSHTHLSGTGCADLGDIRFTPMAGPTPDLKNENYRCKFDHAHEKASPGYYEVLLQDPAIKAQLTATAHAGFHRYTFPAKQPGHLLLDLARGVGDVERDHPKEGSLVVESPTRISGYRRSNGWAPDQTFYFVAEFSRPGDLGEVRGGDDSEHLLRWKGKRVFARLTFKASPEPLLVKVGLSPVSVEAARKNLAAEIPGWDFDATRTAAAKGWSDLLGTIRIETPDPALRETFYSAVYHASLAPTLFNDADGGYCGLDHKPHPFEGFQNYCTFSLWDTFRAEHPLLTIIQPGRVDDFVGSMLAHYRQFGHHTLPFWSLTGNETWCMIGYHSMPVIADAYAKGFRRYDVEAVYQAMRETATRKPMPHEGAQERKHDIREYCEHGYVPAIKNKGAHKQSVARTVEYAFDDWCIAQMAAALGKKSDVELFAKRAANYKNVIDTKVGFARGRFADGAWREPFQPNEMFACDWTEGTSWNYTFFVPQDVPGLFDLLGGDAKCIEKLDRMFDDKSRILGGTGDMTGVIGQYVHGNEPCHHIAYLYCYAGAPWKTQQRIRQIVKAMYDNSPGGLCGNDDCGQMSAWFVFSALGLYPVNPASGVYVLGSPLVDKATIRLDPRYYKGGTFTLVAKNNSPGNAYIQSAALNGQPLARCWISHAELVAGGRLVLKMGPQPNKAWAQRREDRPPTSAYAK